MKALADVVPQRPAGFCTGCPERPIFAAMKLVEKELGPHHVASDIGCHLFSILPPFNIGATTMGYGLGPASASAFNVPPTSARSPSWATAASGTTALSSSIGNAVFNKQDGVILVVDNFYSAATGGQDILSSRADNDRATNNPIVDAVKGIGAKWVRQIDRTYDVAKMRDTLKEALTTPARSEDHRRLVRMHAEQAAPGEAAVRQAVKDGQAHGQGALRRRRGCLHRRPCLHPPVRCPSLSVKHTDDPLKDDPVAAVDEFLRRLRQLRRSRRSRGALPVLLPRRRHPQPDAARPISANVRGAVIGFLQRRRDARRVSFA